MFFSEHVIFPTNYKGM